MADLFDFIETSKLFWECNPQLSGASMDGETDKSAHGQQLQHKRAEEWNPHNQGTGNNNYWVSMLWPSRCECQVGSAAIRGLPG
jgi:hypothetical protein